ncbi:MAG: anti-sigma factor antagonist [Acidimicrobiales bacterium]
MAAVPLTDQRSPRPEHLLAGRRQLDAEQSARAVDLLGPRRALSRGDETASGNTEDAIPFELGVSYAAHETVLSVRGAVDLLTAPAVGALLSALIEGGRSEIVVDASGVTFIDASGLGVIAAASARLRPVGGTITIRSPSQLLRRLIDITAMGELIGVDPIPSGGPLGPEQPSDDQSQPVGAVPSGSAGYDVSRPAALPSGNGVIDAALRLVTALARATVGGADGVSVSLTRHGRLTTVAATDETIAQMDRDQYATGEGPCLAAASEGRWFHVESLTDEDRWPRFISRAIDGGTGSILSTPLTVSAQPVGALNIYSSTERAFGPHDQELAALFATHASGILTGARVDMTVDEVADRLRDALLGREVIAQAQGVVMGRQGSSAEAAHADLRRSSRTAGVTIREWAAVILNNAGREDLIGQVTT